MKLIFSKRILGIAILLIQIVFLAAAFVRFEDYLTYLYWPELILSVCLLIYQVNRSINPAFQISWIVLIAFVPAFSLFLFALLQLDRPPKRIAAKMKHTLTVTRRHLPQNPMYQETCESTPIAGLSHFLRETCGFPVYRNTETRFYALGEEMYADLLADLSAAKKFIFMEYFILRPGSVMDELLELLRRKTQEGVEVRLMYDGMGSLSVMGENLPDQLKQLGICSRVFSPVRPLLSSVHNNRDHRKITVIDGEIAYTGGVNLSDEYINRKVRFGHWKDTAIRLRGDAADSFTMMFLELWNAAGVEEKPNEEEAFSYLCSSSGRRAADEEGWVIPYADFPFDRIPTGEWVYLDLINRAQRELYVETPYFVPTHEIREALKYAAKRGVEVVLILPEQQDKRYMQWLGRSYYSELLESGVKIYEYTPGFIHSKLTIADGEAAVIGTVNYDFRSLFLNYECAAFLYRTEAVTAMHQDAVCLLRDCRAITSHTEKRFFLLSRLLGYGLRLFAPFL